MSGDRQLALYRRLIALYPKAFRQSYGADLLVLFAAHLRDERPGRVWLRVVRDLAVSVPAQHLEARMTRPSPRLVPLVSTLVAGTAALMAVTVGTGAALPPLLVVTLATGAVAVWSFQANRPVAGVGSAVAAWWKFLVAGSGLALLTLLGMAIPWPDAIDLGDNAYGLVVIAFMSSLTLAAAGLILGVGALVRRDRGRHIRASMV